MGKPPYVLKQMAVCFVFLLRVDKTKNKQLDDSYVAEKGHPAVRFVRFIQKRKLTIGTCSRMRAVKSSV